MSKPNDHARALLHGLQGVPMGDACVVTEGPRVACAICYAADSVARAGETGRDREWFTAWHLWSEIESGFGREGGSLIPTRPESVGAALTHVVSVRREARA